MKKKVSTAATSKIEEITTPVIKTEPSESSDHPIDADTGMGQEPVDEPHNRTASVATIEYEISVLGTDPGMSTVFKVTEKPDSSSDSDMRSETNKTENPPDLPKAPGCVTEPQLMTALPKLQVKIKRLDLSPKDYVTVMKLTMASLPNSKYKLSRTSPHHDSRKDVDDYDSDKTEIYYPTEEDTLASKHAVLLNRGIGVTHLGKPKKHLICADPSRGGFKISVHGLVKRRTRTYIGCKIPGCKAKFASIHDWNSHHRKYHKGIKLFCTKCGKLFKTRSFLRDDDYIHSDKRFSCEKCNKEFVFCSMYRIHRRTHLWMRIHKCFTGSRGKEYKWPQDLHRHDQSHLKITYGCSICDYTTSQKYLLKRHLKVHEDKMYYTCARCPFQCKYYTQLSQHRLKCIN